MAAAATSAAKRIVCVVTGGNKGIGFECCRLLASAGPQYDVILAARSKKRGEAAIEALRKSGVDNVRFLTELDIADSKSVESFAAALEEDTGQLDVLLNNAGFAFKGDTFDSESAKTTLSINYFGTMKVTDRLLGLLKQSQDARIVNVCSQAGRLGQVSRELQARFTASDATRESLTTLAEEFLAGVAAGDYKKKGWPKSMYGVSKLLEIAFTKVLARDIGESKTMEVNACCPGWCSTDMSSHRGPRTAAKGAETPVWLCTRDRTGTSGDFYYDLAPIKW